MSRVFNGAKTLAWVLAASPALLGGGPLRASELHCGEVILNDVTLEASLICDSPPLVDGLVIGADGVTVDLNGYTIRGADQHSGISNVGYDGLTVRNGVIGGFEFGLRSVGDSGGEVRDMTFVGQTLDSLSFEISRDVTVVDSRFSLPPGPGSAVVLADTERAVVKNIHSTGAFFGVLAIGYAQVTKRITIEDSVFSGIAHVGVRMVNVDGVIVRNNLMSGSSDCYSGIDVVDGPAERVRILRNQANRCAYGILVDPDLYSSKLIIDHNFLFANEDGMLLLGLQDSRITHNRVHLNNFSGIGVNGGSAGNRIMHNRVTGNRVTDMSHDALSVPNWWLGNVCETSDEGEQVDCP